MKISANYPGFPMTTPAIQRSAGAPEAATAQPEPAITAKERLAKLIEEKHAMAEAAMQAPSPEQELGKLIDLRV
ncbi:hypothetical protein HZB60_00805 [candidate division KSB1 bacterium]|nr:hypothetical protein [candidate division KSB1 bacterium]